MNAIYLIGAIVLGLISLGATGIALKWLIKPVSPMTRRDNLPFAIMMLFVATCGFGMATGLGLLAGYYGGMIL